MKLSSFIDTVWTGTWMNKSAVTLNGLNNSYDRKFRAHRLPQESFLPHLFTFWNKETRQTCLRAYILMRKQYSKSLQRKSMKWIICCQGIPHYWSICIWKSTWYVTEWAVYNHVPANLPVEMTYTLSGE